MCPLLRFNIRQDVTKLISSIHPPLPVFGAKLFFFKANRGHCHFTHKYSCRLKNYSQHKSWELCSIRWEFLGLPAWEAASQRQNCSEVASGEPGYIEVLQQRAGRCNVKRLLLIKESQISQVKEFSTFLCMGGYKSLKSFLWYALQLSGASILCFHILSSLRAHQLPGGGCNHWLTVSTFVYWCGRQYSIYYSSMHL